MQKHLHSSISERGPGWETDRAVVSGEEGTLLHSELPELTNEVTLIWDSTEFFWDSFGLIWSIKAEKRETATIMLRLEL